MNTHKVVIRCERLGDKCWRCTLFVDDEEVAVAIDTSQKRSVKEIHDYAKKQYNINPRVVAPRTKAISGRVRRMASTLGRHGRVLADVVTHEALTGHKARREDVAALARSLRHAGHKRTAKQVETLPSKKR